MNEERGAQESPATRTPRVLFLCTGNSARSQIAEALLRHLGGDAFEVFSAGSHPRPAIHPMARAAVKDLFGLEMSGQHPKGLGNLSGPFDWIISYATAPPTRARFSLRRGRPSAGASRIRPRRREARRTGAGPSGKRPSTSTAGSRRGFGPTAS